MGSMNQYKLTSRTTRSVWPEFQFWSKKSEYFCKTFQILKYYVGQTKHINETNYAHELPIYNLWR